MILFNDVIPKALYLSCIIYFVTPCLWSGEKPGSIHVSGTIKDEEGNPLKDVSISVYFKPSEKGGLRKADGKFEVKGQGRSVLIDFFKDGYHQQRTDGQVLFRPHDQSGR